MLIMEETGGGEEVYGNSLYFLLNFSESAQKNEVY